MHCPLSRETINLMMKKILLTVVLGLGLILPTSVLADGDPVITSVSTQSANNGDTITITGQNFLVANTDVGTLTAYLFMQGGGSYTLAKVSPLTNNTNWQQSSISFKITDSIARSGTITLTVNSKIASWNQTFNMNGGVVPTSTPTPNPTSVVATPTRTPTPNPTSSTNSNTTVNPTSTPRSSTLPTYTPTARPTRAIISPVPTNIPLITKDIVENDAIQPAPKTSWFANILASITNLFKSLFKR